MSAPTSGPLGDEAQPAVEIRRSLAPSASGGGYGGVESGLPPPDPSEASVNGPGPSNGQPGGGGGGFNIFRRAGRADKAPLLNSDRDELMRSLSGSVPQPPGSTPGSGPLNPRQGRREGLSTFSGVFAPVCLSMFSVLLFLRMGYVVGFAGIAVTLGMLCLAYAIILLTVFSLCAISTNGAIEGGGVYYMISRALGPEFGGSIGTLFFLANVFANALYIAGFVEISVSAFGPQSDLNLLSNDHWAKFGYGIAVSIIILLICLVGAALFAKTSLVILAIVAGVYGSTIVSFFAVRPLNVTASIETDRLLWPPYNGSAYPPNVTDDNALDYYKNQSKDLHYTGFALKTFRGNWNFNLTEARDYSTPDLANVSFALVFGVVFSGVTGIMAGANMSGDLRAPNVSIPNGTLFAVLFTFAVYIVTTLFVGGTCPRELLRNDFTVLQEVNVWAPLIVIGVMSTTLFAGLSNLIGASRVLVRMAEDKLFGAVLNPFVKLSAGNNPILAVVFSWLLSVIVLLIGALNQIAQITSIFFLLSYVGVNLACLALDLASAPNFRPTFRFFSSHTALAGAVGCTVMMFVVDAAMSGIAVILLMLLLLLLHYKAPIASWGSISQALIFHQVRKYLLLLDSRKDHVKYWRPQMLLLVNSPQTCLPLIDFVNDLKKSGLYIMGHVRKGRLEDHPMDPLIEEMPYWLSLVDHMNIKCFTELTIATSVREGLQQLMRIAGLGAMKPNTVILGFHDSERGENTLESGRMLRELKYAKLERAEVVEYFTQGSHQLGARSDDRLTVHEYVSMLQDVIKMNKNLVLARHFAKLDKDLIFKSPRELRSLGPPGLDEAMEEGTKVSSRRYVDVWPVELGRRSGVEGGEGWDNSCLFTLQLACILHMVPGWRRRTRLRVFLCVTSLQDMQRRERQLRDMLNELRITAKSVVVPWDHVICNLPEAQPSQGSPNNVPMAQLPDKYLSAMNEMVKKHSEETAVTFLNIPTPPAVDSEAAAYHRALTAITDGLPPTLLVHGLSSVISTAL